MTIPKSWRIVFPAENSLPGQTGKIAITPSGIEMAEIQIIKFRPQFCSDHKPYTVAKRATPNRENRSPPIEKSTPSVPGICPARSMTKPEGITKTAPRTA